jgi:predicted GNAT family acetyltransferase
MGEVDDDVTVENNAAAHRYELRLGGELAGVAVYHLEGDDVVFTHTEVGDDVEGQGLGSALAKQALDDVRAAGRRARPVCPFIAAFIRHHQEYVDLVDEAHRAEVIAS